MPLSQFSVQSRLLTPVWNDRPLSSATGFVFVHREVPYLITNWHVVSGRNSETGASLSSHGVAPDALVVRHFMSPLTGQAVPLVWADYKEPLRAEDESPLWLEHPEYGHQVDVVALPLTNVSGAQLLPYSVNSESPAVRIAVSDWVSIIGFPLGAAASDKIAIWTRGSVASEPEIDFNGLPYFLIDARTRQGQSGSPVLFYTNGGPVVRPDGSIAVTVGVVSELLGIYSGRINSESDIGRVWKVRVIKEIIEGGQQGQNT